ncbi:type IV secretory system conjugative DNA transfer family protein [Caulobacter hibisci]|uniref:Type IV secretory system conjugative DNA transfer family protein n=1 Tax=Caulobacter hibisci TaxID=2035993 RepID=A0ABS0T048_9CAUL|nr:type IV secretory system conjugative DNA transfer family protein [Caulobacter hibisci]MBI1684283.1 type IV secretory system conjugative DNA transfer family protein [Caulobacter hibisci]
MTLAKKRRWILPLVALMAIAGLAAATQTIGHLFAYTAGLGDGWGAAGGVRLYPPWAIVGWYARHAGRYPRAFDQAALNGLAVFVLPLLILAGLTRRFVARPRPFGTAAWGDAAEARRAGLANGERLGGRVLGRLGGRLLTFLGVEHWVIVGASRSGKGAGHVVPTIVSWAESLFVYDRKGELWHITADHRRKLSHTFYFAPTDPDTARWNPLFEVRKGPMEIADIQNIVGILVDPIGLKQGNLDFFDQSAANFFTGVILHALYTEPDELKTLAHVRRLLIDIEPTLDAMLGTRHRWRPDGAAADGLARDAGGEPIAEVHPEVWLGATAFRSMEPRVRSSVLATAQKSLALWADPLVANATSWSDFCIGDLACASAPVSFYLITPQAHADRLAFLVRVMLRQSLNSLMETIDADSRGRRKRHKLLMMLDEFPKLGALAFLENALGEMAGYGLVAHLICQSFNDVFKHYGVHTSIFDNCHGTAAFATSEPGSIERIVKRAGRSLEMRESFSDPRLMFGKGHRSRNQAEVERYVLAEQDVRGLPGDKQFLFVNNAKPFLADKLRYFDEPLFAAHTRDFFHGERARFVQTRATLDTPGAPPIDWLGVRAVEPYAAPLQRVPEPGPLACADGLSIVDLIYNEAD